MSEDPLIKHEVNINPQNIDRSQVTDSNLGGGNQSNRDDHSYRSSVGLFGVGVVVGILLAKMFEWPLW